MNTADSQVLPAPPSLMKALTAGFDAISNHVGLIVFSIALDLLLWLGPRLSIARLVENIFNQAASLPEMSTPEMSDMISSGREMWRFLAEHFNLFSVLRTFPVGIPSLMASRSPLGLPDSAPQVWQVSSVIGVLGLWLVLTLIGLVAGALYFTAIGQAVTHGRLEWQKVLKVWPWASGQVLMLAIFWLALLLGVSVPFSCLLSIFLVGGFQVGPLGLLLFGFLLVWLFLPLVFSPHGIFVNHRSMWNSVLDGMKLTRQTLPYTSLFILIIFVLSQGLDVLWNIPAGTSWFTVIGVVGHAFVTTALVAATFVYYQDATQWLQRKQQQERLVPGKKRI